MACNRCYLCRAPGVTFFGLNLFCFTTCSRGFVATQGHKSYAHNRTPLGLIITNIARGLFMCGPIRFLTRPSSHSHTHTNSSQMNRHKLFGQHMPHSCGNIIRPVLRLIVVRYCLVHLKLLNADLRNYISEVN